MPFITGGSSGGGGAISGVVVTGNAVSGQVPVASSAVAGAWAYPPGFEINYTQITASVNVVGTAEATPTVIISPGAITFDGTPVMVEFSAYSIVPPTGGFIVVSLYESTTVINRLLIAAGVNYAGKFGMRFTPTAASHTYTISSYAQSTTGTPNVSAGAGGAGAASPAWVRFTKA